MQNKKTLIFVFSLAMLIAISGCIKKQPPKPVANTNTPLANQNVNANVNTNTNTPDQNGDEEEIDTSDWLTYRNEEYGFEVKYPKEWNIFNRPAFSKYERKRGELELGFTYDDIIEDIEPIHNIVGVKLEVDEYKEDYFKNRENNILIPVIPQETWGCKCQPEEVCYDLEETVVADREAIKYNYIGSEYGNPNYEAVAIKLNKNKILYIRYAIDNTEENHKIETEVNKIISTVKIW